MLASLISKLHPCKQHANRFLLNSTKQHVNLAQTQSRGQAQGLKLAGSWFESTSQLSGSTVFSTETTTLCG